MAHGHGGCCRGPAALRSGNAMRAGVAILVVGLAGFWLLPPPRPAATATPAHPSVLDPERVTRGRQVYLKHCASCHGPNAEGALNWTQPDARGNLPPPPHDDSGHTWRHPDAQLADIIRNGMRDPFNQTSELTMLPFTSVLGEEEIAAVIVYFKSLWSPEHRQYQDEQNRRPPMPMQGSSR